MNDKQYEPQILTVSQINQYLKTQFDHDPNLKQVAVRGEISNYKCYPSGHHYFSMKDADGVLSCVMFRSSAQTLRFVPKNGMQVIAFGRITVFPRDGRYQLYVDFMSMDGVGDLYAAYERLKEKLDKEGLFDPTHKKPIPAFPERIALITSASGDAVHDMIRNLGIHWPMAKVLVLSVRVQGEKAPAEMVGALRYANRWKVADVIIIGRGGGSIEELWAFNDEQLAREIYASEIPVVSAVGHEPDVSLSDYVADLRAATPTKAGEVVVPDQKEMYNHLNQLKLRLGRVMQEKLRRQRLQLQRLEGSRVLQDPTAYIKDKRLVLDFQQDKLLHALERNVAQHRRRHAMACAALDSLSPLKVLARGYALAQTEDGTILTSVKGIETGDQLKLTLSDGTLSCHVTERKQNNGSEEENI